MTKAAIGIINLDVEPERVAPQEDTPGFLRNDATLPFRVKREIARGATIDRVVRGDPELIPSFTAAAKALEARGVKAIIGDCGFISSYQTDVASAVNVPFYSSSLLLVPLAYQATGRRVGIITAEAKNLSERHFKAVGWTSTEIPVAIKGMDEYPLENWTPLTDGWKNMKNLIKLTGEMLRESLDVGSLVFECTMIQPYAGAISEDTALPVYDITTLARLAYSTVNPPRYGWARKPAPT